MSTINPFGKLKVEREESSDEDFKEVKDTKIDYSLKTAEIELETVGRKKILEEFLKDGSTLVYKEEEGFMDTEPS